MDNNQIWQGVLGELELSLSKANFTTWFKETSVLLISNGEYVIGVPNGFTKEWLQNKYHKDIARALQNITSSRVTKLTYEINKKNTAQAVDSLKPVARPAESFERKQNVMPSQDIQTGLNPKYIFENFIIGPNNELAKAAATAICKSPGKIYNPFFIYGGVGLGKTHLVQAIGNRILQENKDTQIVYATSEKFINDFINFIRNKNQDSNTVNFQNFYRNCDVLIIDDIQFLAGKVSSQEAFFHAYNSLFQNNKQIILTSDRPPKAISGLEARLVSRFEGGMVADVSAPDLETRKAILSTKCREKAYNVPEDVLDFIASNVQSNIRELEGALSRVIAHSQLSNSTPTLESCKTILTDIITAPSKQTTSSKEIIEAVASFYDIDPSDIMAKNRRKDIAWPRQIAMFLMRRELNKSYPTIGDETGGRDHTTAIHAYEKVKKELEKNDNLKQEIEAIKQKMYVSSC
ncbi:MAG: chromosomal replication initiator protein DnaA [Patescibacteria group bacterium]|jgi:chromosomal replication initiator protein